MWTLINSEAEFKSYQGKKGYISSYNEPKKYPFLVDSQINGTWSIYCFYVYPEDFMKFFEAKNGNNS